MTNSRSTPFGEPSGVGRLRSTYQLSSSCTCANIMTNSRSTPFGEPSGFACPRAVMIIGPSSPVFGSRYSSVCECYFHNTELTTPDVNSVLGMYQSHTDEYRDPNTGLLGP